MDSWQAWAAVVVGFVLSKIGWDSRQEKVRTDKFKDDIWAKQSELSERITRVESEIVTEREVREVLHELITPFTSGLAKIEQKQDTIASDLVEIKLALAAIPKRKEEQ